MIQTRKSKRATNVLVNNSQTTAPSNPWMNQEFKAGTPTQRSLERVSTKPNKPNVNSTDVNLSFDYEPSYEPGSLEQSSVELLFHYLRFHVFKTLEDSKKKTLFYELGYVPCKEPTIFKQIVEFANTKNYEGMLALAQKNKLSIDFMIQLGEQELEWIDKKIASQLEVKQVRTMETIIDAWFVEENPYLAYSLLLHLLYTTINDEEIKAFAKFYSSFSPLERKELVVYTKHNMYQL